MFSTSLSFRLIILLFNGVIHGGSTWWFIKDLIPSRSVHQDSFLRSLSFFILQSGVQFFLPYHWRWYYVILDNLSSCFMIHMLLRMSYFKSINLFFGAILGDSSPKAFPKDCCYYGAYKWPKSFIYLPGEISFSPPSSYQSSLLFSLVAEFSPHKVWDGLHKPTTTLFFSCC